MHHNTHPSEHKPWPQPETPVTTITIPSSSLLLSNINLFCHLLLRTPAPRAQRTPSMMCVLKHRSGVRRPPVSPALSLTQSCGVRAGLFENDHERGQNYGVKQLRFYVHTSKYVVLLYLLDMRFRMPCCPNKISCTREQIMTHTMGLMSTPNAGGMIALVCFRIGSVGHATRF